LMWKVNILPVHAYNSILRGIYVELNELSAHDSHFSSKFIDLNQTSNQCWFKLLLEPFMMLQNDVEIFSCCAWFITCSKFAAVQPLT